ncbi:MAG: GNAT family N-acetyltransferase [Propionibacteriaceae bacterium]|nr:GNAT family N-acetyltransferase [Propionibacteriaceae bacterium]
MRTVDPPAFPSRHRWPVALKYDPLLLSSFRVSDRQEVAIVRTRNMTWLNPWEATPPQPSLKPVSHGRHARKLASNARAGRTLPWMIRWMPADPAPIIGQITLTSIMYGSAMTGSLGYWIDHSYAGRGIIPVAVALVTDYAMTTMGLHRIEICIRPENRASLRVVEKLGFRYEGSRPRFIHIAGSWRDHEVFALTQEEVGPGLLSRVSM